MPQRIKLELILAFSAFTVEVMGLRDAITVEQEHLNNLYPVVLGRQHDGSDVGRKLRIIGAWSLPEGIGVAIQKFLIV